MIDLHVHSLWSDGARSPHEIISDWNRFRMVSVTDHNTLSGVIHLLTGKTFPKALLPGFETRLWGEPDYLFYLPTRDVARLKEAERDLCELRQGDHMISRFVYEKLYGDSEFDAALEVACQWYSAPERFCTTRELGWMVAAKRKVSHNDVSAFKAVLTDIRKYKSEAMKGAWEGSIPQLASAAQSSAPHYKDPMTWLSAFANRHSAIVALAHPLRTLIRSRRLISRLNKDEALQELTLMFNRFLSIFPYGALEYTNYGDSWINKHFKVSEAVLSHILIKEARYRSMPVVIGSDAHRKDQEPFEWVSSLGKTKEILTTLLPEPLIGWGE